MVGYCKLLGSVPLYTASNLASLITGISEKDIVIHMLHNKVFHYYVYCYSKEFEVLGKDVPFLICHDYCSFEEDLDEQGFSGLKDDDSTLESSKEAAEKDGATCEVK